MQSEQNVICHCISTMPNAGIKTQIGNGFEIQPPDYWVYDHLKSDLALLIHIYRIAVYKSFICSCRKDS